MEESWLGELDTGRRWREENKRKEGVSVDEQANWLEES